MTPAVPEAALRAGVARALTPPEKVEALRFVACGWPPAPAKVWRLEAHAQVLYLKQHPRERPFQQELEAYARLSGLPAVSASLPALLAAMPEHRALLLTEVPGVLVEGAERTAEVRLEVHREAGAWLRHLHASACDDADPVDLSEAMRRRSRAALRRASGLVPADLLKRAEAVIGEGEAFQGQARVMCHRDYQPRNWLWQDAAAPRFGVIDLEHSRADARESDWVRLVVGPWRGAPELRGAFFSAYGEPPEGSERRTQALVALHALGSLSWGRRHADPAFEEEGRRLLATI